MAVEAQPARLKELIAKLPTTNYATLKRILGLCSKVRDDTMYYTYNNIDLM